MRIHQGLATSAGSLTGAAVAIGNFDGVHRGHQALFAAARCARVAAALTFEPHPARVLAPQYAPPLICTLQRKRELIAACGISELIEQPFDARFASTPPEAFVELLLGTGLAEVVIGHDFTYGKGRTGQIDSLRAALDARGVRLTVIPPVAVDGLVCSSTKVREFVLEGRVEAANLLLGRPFDLDGEVVRGAGRGRKIGFPTANLRTFNELLPAVGVYAVRAQPGTGPVLAGAANLGLNPTFRDDAHAGAEGRPKLTLEVHLVDVDQDLYGQPMRVQFVHRLRDERRFPGVDALVEQIRRDVADARRLLGA